MSTQTFLLPDVGEGLTEAEIVTWRVAPGDAVRESSAYPQPSTRAWVLYQ